jgi:hypothetical protein
MSDLYLTRPGAEVFRSEMAITLDGELRVVFYQYGGESQSGLQPVGSSTNWRCVVLEKLSKVKLLEDAWRTAPNHSRPDSCVTSSDIDVEDYPSQIHKMDIEGVAWEGVGQGRFSMLRSNVDYDALGGLGDPRGRKSGGGSAVRNPRLPARAEGEKRFRSATRNP